MIASRQPPADPPGSDPSLLPKSTLRLGLRAELPHHQARERERRADPANRRARTRSPFSGWAVDPSARKPAKLVLVALGERVVAQTTPQISRSDVQQSLSDKAFRRSGYEVKVPRGRIAGPTGRPDLASLRVYALLHDGRVLQLPHAPSAGWQPTSPLPAELRLGRRRFPVASEAANRRR